MWHGTPAVSDGKRLTHCDFILWLLCSAFWRSITTVHVGIARSLFQLQSLTPLVDQGSDNVSVLVTTKLVNHVPIVFLFLTVVQFFVNFAFWSTIFTTWVFITLIVADATHSDQIDVHQIVIIVLYAFPLTAVPRTILTVRMIQIRLLHYLHFNAIQHTRHLNHVQFNHCRASVCCTDAGA